MNKMLGIKECGHVLCPDCYKGYLEEKLKEGAPCVTATCPTEGCVIVVPLNVWEKVVP